MCDDTLAKPNVLALLSTFLVIASLEQVTAGFGLMPSLPPFSMSLRTAVPASPRVISPSPTPTDLTGSSGSFGPTTRNGRRNAVENRESIDEGVDEDDQETESPQLTRARAKSKTPVGRQKDHKCSSGPAFCSNEKLEPITQDGHLSLPSASRRGWSWQDLSRSPSPLGLIPIHRHWRVFVHRHEVPRKVLHISIGFFTTWLYISGVQTTSITPYLMLALIPIATVDYLRHTYPSLNRTYVRALGAFMRETEFEGWNGVIWYLLGAWIVLRFFPKDVGVMGVLLLSWCDTAASTLGRAYGRYTPRLRKGKTLAGSLAAFATGVATAMTFWGWLAPKYGPSVDNARWPFMFTGTLRLPGAIRGSLSLLETQSSISGSLALGAVSLWTGLVASASEVVDIFGWDDNLTIPVLSGLGIWGFLKLFGESYE